MHGNGLMDVDVDCSVEEYSYEEGSDVVVLPNTEAVDANFEGLVSVYGLRLGRRRLCPPHERGACGSRGSERWNH